MNTIQCVLEGLRRSLMGVLLLPRLPSTRGRVPAPRPDRLNHTHGRGYSDERSPAHPEQANRLRHGVYRVEVAIGLLAWEERLIQDADPVGGRPRDG